MQFPRSSHCGYGAFEIRTERGSSVAFLSNAPLLAARLIRECSADAHAHCTRWPLLQHPITSLSASRSRLNRYKTLQDANTDLTNRQTSNDASAGNDALPPLSPRRTFPPLFLSEKLAVALPL